MNEPATPQSTQKLLATTLRLYLRNPVKFASLSIAGPAAIFALGLRYGGVMAVLRHPQSSTAAPAILGLLAGMVIVLAGLSISSAATVEAVATASRDSKVRVVAGYSALAKWLLQIIGIMLSVFIRAFAGSLLFIGAGVAALALAAALGFNSRVEAGIIGYVCGGLALTSAVFASMWICARYSVAVQACIVEGIGVRQALKRSTFLISADRGSVTLIHLGFLTLVFAAFLIFSAPVLLLGVSGIAFRLSIALAGFIAVALTSPVATICVSLVYYLERARKDADRPKAKA
jgi:hypothetical protein